jgi:hypothetical protein
MFVFSNVLYGLATVRIREAGSASACRADAAMRGFAISLSTMASIAFPRFFLFFFLGTHSG